MKKCQICSSEALQKANKSTVLTDISIKYHEKISFDFRGTLWLPSDNFKETCSFSERAYISRPLKLGDANSQKLENLGGK